MAWICRRPAVSPSSVKPSGATPSFAQPSLGARSGSGGHPWAGHSPPYKTLLHLWGPHLVSGCDGSNQGPPISCSHLTPLSLSFLIHQMGITKVLSLRVGMTCHEMRLRKAQRCAWHTVGAPECGTLGIARRSEWLVGGEDGEVGRAYGHPLLWACPAFLQNHSPQERARGRGGAANARRCDWQRRERGPTSRIRV